MDIDFVISESNEKIKHKLNKKELVAVQQIVFEGADDRVGTPSQEFIVNCLDTVSAKYVTTFGGKKSKEIQYIDCHFVMGFSCIKDLQWCEFSK